MLIDFHTHTSASDGALSPLELLKLARARGVGMLAITDHDTVQGYLSAARELDRHASIQSDLLLVPGVELSCRWSATTVHIVGLGFDCSHDAMLSGLSTLAVARKERSETIASRLEKLGFAGALSGASVLAGDGQLGRPHFADWMVAEGHVKDHATAFDRFLGQGKTGDVKAYWPELKQVVSWIVAAGGVAVLAHPLKYRFTRMKLRRMLTDFVAAGGGAIELTSGRQGLEQITQLRRLAAEFKLEVSVGSDYHRDGAYFPPPGIELPKVKPLTGVWERWLPQSHALMRGATA
ncbi:MAG: PHP domain-containing protein [Pseudomonadota bacterium]